MDKLPANRIATAYFRESDDNVHALAASRKGRDVMLTYRGRSPDYKPLLAQLGDGAALDFGPLPATTIAAVTLNFKLPAPPNEKQINHLLAGKSFRADMLPKLGAPIVAFLGEVPGEELEPKRSFSLPVAGLSIRLKDASVAADLTNAINILVVMANFAAAKWEAPDIPVRDVIHREAAFRVADVGPLLSSRAKRDEFKPINVAYGRVGDWYVICSQEKFFTQCVDANIDPSRRFVASAPFQAMALQGREGPILTAVLRPAALAAHVDGWLAHLRSARSQVVEESHKEQPGTLEAQFVRGARIAAGLLGHYQSMTLQAYRDGDGIAAEASVIRR